MSAGTPELHDLTYRMVFADTEVDPRDVANIRGFLSSTA